MKLASLLFVLTIAGSSLAQEANVKISGSVFKSGVDSVYLTRKVGSQFVDLYGARLGKNGEFNLDGKIPNPDYYFLRFGKQHLYIILRANSNVKVYGDGSNLSQFLNFVDSDESHAINEYLRLSTRWSETRDAAVAKINANPSKKDSIDKTTSSEFTRFQSLRSNFIATNSNSAALLPAFLETSPKEDFATYESLANQLVKAFPESPTIKTIAVDLAKAVEERERNNPLGIGKIAPDFEEKKIDGTTMKLSDLRGKVVLLDFWASWCGPCRRENPNVVQLYEKYKDDGFTVMGVSLDKTKENWVDAIEKDGLVWPNHVSDLASWACKAGKLYGVSSIPHTVLIDRDGKILKLKIRGVELAQELQRIFGH